MAELYLYFRIRLHGVVLNQFSTSQFYMNFTLSYFRDITPGIFGKVVRRYDHEDFNLHIDP
jgi:hypothetical protein